MNREYIIENFEDMKVLDSDKIHSYPFHRNNVEKTWGYKVGIGVGYYGNFKYEYLISVNENNKLSLKCRESSSKWTSYKEFVENITMTDHLKSSFQQKIFETIMWMLDNQMIAFLKGEYKDELHGSY